MSRMTPAKAIRPNIRALNNDQLNRLVAELAQSTKLEQSILAGARREQRRRRKKPAEGAVN